jgi:choline dehydrogenase-like flavoprotein
MAGISEAIVTEHRAVPAGIITRDDVGSEVRVSCAVVVVGSGAGGATIAAELADAGVDVVIVEEGSYHPTESFQTAMGHALRTLYRDGGASTAIGTPPILFSEGRCVGGSTVVNGGMSFRTPDRVLHAWARDGAVPGFAPEAMRPHFEHVERRLHVAQQDPETIGRDAELLKAGADAKGWRIVANTRNQIHCAGSNNCTLGCPTGAKQSMLLTNVPRALARGARLYADCRVDRVTRHRGAAIGVEGHFIGPGGTRGPRLQIMARIVVISGGAVQTPALLMRSGFQSASGQLGRNLAMHPNAKLVALFDEEVRGWHGVHQAYQVREYEDEGIIITAVNLPPSLVAMGIPDHGRALAELMRDYDRMVVAGCLIEDSATGTVRNLPGLGPQVFYEISERDADRVVRGIGLTAELMFAAGARRVLSPFAGAPDLRGPDDVAALLSRRIPRRSLELFTVHLMGTARMSDDPARGVVSSYGEFHGARGLFIADASMFPGPVGLNPMETIVALVTRNAQWLVDNRSRFDI